MAEPNIRFKRNDGTDYPAWESKLFSDVFESLQNNTFSRDSLNYEGGNVKNIHYGDVLIKYGSVVDVSDSTVPFINESENVSKFRDESYLVSGDIVIADTAEDETVGKVTEVLNDSGEKVLAGLHTIPVRPREEYAKGFLGAYMNSEAYHSQLYKLMQGIKVTSVSKGAIADTYISTPDVEEQQKIAEFLSSVDEVIATSEDEIASLEKQKKAMMQKIFSQEVRFKKDDGSDYPEWKEISVAQIGKVVTGNTPPTKEVDNYGGDFLWVTPTDIGSKAYINMCGRRLTEKGKKKARVLPKGTVLVTCIASIGKNCILSEEGSCNQQINAIIPNGKMDSYFIYLSVEYKVHDLELLGGNGGMKIVSKGLFEDFTLPYPEIEEQKKIADFFTDMDEAIESAKLELEKWKELKKGLLQQMFV